MLEQNLSERIKQFKKIDAHSHVGYFGSWCDVGITPEELIAQMDEYNVEKSVICTYPIQDSLDAVDKYPDRLVGAAWLNPMDPDCLDILKDAVKNHNFKAVKLHRWNRLTARMTSVFFLSQSWHRSLRSRS